MVASTLHAAMLRRPAELLWGLAGSCMAACCTLACVVGLLVWCCGTSSVSRSKCLPAWRASCVVVLVLSGTCNIPRCVVVASCLWAIWHGQWIIKRLFVWYYVPLLVCVCGVLHSITVQQASPAEYAALVLVTCGHMGFNKFGVACNMHMEDSGDSACGRQTVTLLSIMWLQQPCRLLCLCYCMLTP